MQRNLRHAAWGLVANASLLVTACATAIVPDVGGPTTAGSSTSGGDEGAMAGSSGAVASAGRNTNGGTAGTSEGGTASGGAGRDGGTGGANAGSGGKGGTGGANAGSGGKGGTGGANAGTGGKGGNGGNADTGGKGGTGGTVTGGGGTGGTVTGGGGTGGGGGGGGVNLITNSGFETNTTGWSVFGGSATIATTTAQAHSGTQSLVITGRTQTYQGPQYSVLSLVTPGTSYSLSLWGRLPSTNSTGSLIVTLHYTCSGGSSAGENYFTWVPSTPASATSWTQFSGVQTFPACAGGGTMTAAALYVESPTATLSYYVDDVVLTTP